MLPASFLNSLQNTPGFQLESFKRVHETSQAITSIRRNQFKKWDTGAHSFLHLNDSETNVETVPWCRNAFYLKERPSFVLDPLWHAGAYYVQEASSMFVQYILEQLKIPSQSVVIDVCAAPGGKSTLLANYFYDGLIISNEIIKSRNAILVENLTKWGADNTVVTQNDPSHFASLPQFFDLMLIDAPCSGSGLFRKDPDAIKEWSEENVQHCSLRQQRIVEETAAALKQGGYLIYSTCSYSMEEDEKIMDHIASIPGFQNVSIPIPASWNIVTTESAIHHAIGYRFYPDQVKGEGFFISIFQKIEDTSNYYSTAHFNFTPLTKNEINVIQNHFELPQGYQLISHQSECIAIPSKYENELRILLSHWYVKKMGMSIGEIKGKDLIPAHQLAMSYWATLPYQRHELNIKEALDYLRRASLQMEGPKGWTLMTFQNIGLGWAKILPQRCNNYYPNEWRILNY